MRWPLTSRRANRFVKLMLIGILGIVALLYINTTGTIFAKSQQPSVIEGVIDLTDWDFKQDGMVRLNGDWSFYWKQLLPNNASLPQSGGVQFRDDSFVPVPSVWNRYSIEGKHLPGEGFATYQIKIIMPEHHGRMAFKVLSMSTAYKMIVNGQVIAVNGVVSKEAKEAVGQLRPQVVLLPESTGDLDVYIQVSNYQYDRGGIWYSIILGSEEQILRTQVTGIGQDLFLSGSVFILGLYHISLYLLRRLDKSDIYFGIGCLLVSVRALVTGEMFIVNLFPDLNIHISVFIEYMTYCWGMLFFSLFFKAFYPKESSTIFIKIQFGLTVLFSLIVSLFPMPFYTALIQSFHIVVLISCLNAIIIIIRAWHRQIEVRIQTFCTLFLIVTIVHDMLYNNAMIDFIPNQIVPVGIVLFLFSQAFISARRRAEAYNQIREMSDKLMSLDRLKDDFLARTSHELKTPIHGILNISLTLLEGTGGKLNRFQKDNLEIIVSTTRRLTQLINDTLDFSRLKHTDIALDLQSVNVYAVIDSSLDVFHHLAAGKPIRLNNRLADNLPNVWADENRITQILFNLVGNAIKFTESGEIIVSARLQDSTLIISVQDTGIGIPQHEHEIIFQSFEQTELSSHLGYGGTGLGLSISKKLVELQGGQIWVESEVGRGSTFLFTLPIHDSNDGHSQVSVRDELWLPPVAAASTSQVEEPMFTILAVDDETTNLLVLKNAFIDSKYRVLTATNGMDALNWIAQEQHIDLVILDVMMPGMSGLDVCRKIREQYSISELPILLVTAQNHPFDLQNGFGAGANDYLSKPFELVELRARVGTLLELKKSINDLMKSEMDFLQAQIKPHFLYNTINTIISFCRHDAAKAADLLVEFSNYLRGSFDFQKRETFVPLEREIELVHSYLAIEQARFGSKLTVQSDTTYPSGYRVPHLIIQPIVENAVRHGLSPKRDGGTVTLLMREQDGCLIISVSDDGVGISAHLLQSLKERRAEGVRVGVGLANINRRLQGMYGSGLEIESEIGRGTSIKFKIPKHTEDKDK
jgi:two-component system sensor histidine kinase ChiS